MVSLLPEHIYRRCCITIATSYSDVDHCYNDVASGGVNLDADAAAQ